MDRLSKTKNRARNIIPTEEGRVFISFANKLTGKKSFASPARREGGKVREARRRIFSRTSFPIHFSSLSFFVIPLLPLSPFPFLVLNFYNPKKRCTVAPSPLSTCRSNALSVRWSDWNKTHVYTTGPSLPSICISSPFLHRSVFEKKKKKLGRVV